MTLQVIAVLLLLPLTSAFTYLPFMNTLFSSAPIPLALWLDVLAVGLEAYILVELEKWLQRKLAR